MHPLQPAPTGAAPPGWGELYQRMNNEEECFYMALITTTKNLILIYSLEPRITQNHEERERRNFHTTKSVERNSRLSPPLSPESPQNLNLVDPQNQFEDHTQHIFIIFH